MIQNRRLHENLNLKSWSLAGLLLTTAVPATHAEVDLDRAVSTLIPKRETGVLEFLEKYPSYDGRDTVIAIFDTGVDPAALGLQTTTTGERKLVDIIDGSGAGDVDMGHRVDLSKVDEENPLIGLSGRPLSLPTEIADQDIEIRLGMKRGSELFHSSPGSVPGAGPWSRLKEARKNAWRLKNNQTRAARVAEQGDADRTWADKHPSDQSLEEQDLAARESALESLEKSFLGDDPGPVYDCLLWSSGETFKVVVDTDEDGDFSDETILQPFGIAGEYARFADPISSTFGVQVYEDGDLLSIVTVSGSHGTHVAAIAAAHFPDDPDRNGIAPGAKIVSVRMGDIRTRGSSNYFGEMRAVASAAQHKVDIMNASWGGDSTYQDGSELSAKLYNKLVRDYGVTAFVSAGNNGPGLSTLGSPGGEAAHVIGVGAYVSPDMGKYLYALSEESPPTAYGFTSRGPAKNGDMGVDIFAPGGATASLASDSLRGSQLYNGTSMAAPSAAGVGALLVSAAKQLDIPHSPERIRAALENTTTSIDAVPFAQGTGLIQAGPALAFLEETASDPVWDLHFKMHGPKGTFRSGPGLYLREPLKDAVIDVPITITPEFPEGFDDNTSYAWESDVVLKTTAPWLKAPEYVRLANGTQRATLTIDAQKLSELDSAAFAEMTGHLASNPELTLFSFPVTIIQPEPLTEAETFTYENSYALTTSQHERIFLQAPDRADHVELTLKLADNDKDVRRRIVVNVMSLADDASFNEKKFTEYVWFTPGEEKSFTAAVHGGQVVEITLNQYWSTPDTHELELKAEFSGVGAFDKSLAIAKNYDFTTLRIHPLADLRGKVSAKLDSAAKILYATETERFPGDLRMLFPATPEQVDPYLPFRLRQTFKLKLDEETKIKIGEGRPYDTFQDLGGNFYTVYDAKGELVYAGSSFRMKPTAVDAGILTITREILTFEEAIYDASEDRPLIVELDAKVGSIAVYPSIKNISSGSASGAINLRENTHQTFYLKNTQAEAISKLDNNPDVVLGSVEITNGDDVTVAEIPLWVQPGDVFSEVSNKDPKPKEAKDEPTPLEDLKEALYEENKDFVTAHLKATDEALADHRDKLLAKLIEENPEKAELYLIGAQLNATHALLIPEFMGRPEEKKNEEWEDEETSEEASKESSETPEEDPQPNLEMKEPVIRDLEKAQELSDLAEVAQYFGAKPANFPGDTEVRQENEELEKEMKAARDLIADTWLWQAAMAIELEDREAFKNAYVELKKWEPSDSDDTTKLMSFYYEQHGLHGLALKEINKTLKEDPSDSEAFKKRIELYKELGWDTFAERDELILKLRKAAPLNLF